MPDKRVSVPLLAGGLSRAPAALRLPDQLGVADDVICSVAKGTCKRQGMRFRYSIGPTSTYGNAALHTIERDTVEQYHVVAYRDGSDNKIKVFKTDGTPATMTILATATQTYLNAGSAVPSDLRMKTIADGTFIVNSKAIPATKTTASFLVNRTFRDYGVMESYVANFGEYFRTLESDETYSAGYWQYDDQCEIDQTTGAITSGATLAQLGANPAFAKATFQNVDKGGGTDGWALPQGPYDAETNVGTHTFAFRRYRMRKGSDGSLWAAPVYTWNGTTKVLTIPTDNNYVWKSGDMINVLTGWTAGWYLITEKLSATTYRIPSGPAGSTPPGTTTVSFGRGGDVLMDMLSDSYADMDAVAARMQKLIAVIHPHVTVTFLLKDSNVGSSTRIGNFEIGGPYRGKDSLVFAPVWVSGGNWTTTGALGGYVSVPPSTTALFVNDELEPAKRWIRVGQPAQADGAPDETTLPLLMKRTGSVASPTFTAAAGPWKPRYNGTTSSNRPPSILRSGRPISDLCVFRDRMAISGGENICLSQSGDYFNFFADDAANITDSDPIDVSPNVPAVASVQRMVPLGRSLLVLAEGGRQFELFAADALTPSTVTYTPSTSHLSLDVSPAVAGPTAYFPATVPNGYTLMEYYRSEDNGVPENATDVANHVEGLLTSAYRIASEPSTRTVVVLPTPSAGADLWVYRSFFIGAQKRQSAWSVMKMGATFTVRDVAVIGKEFWFLVESNGTLAVYSWVPDDSSASTVYLDSLATVSGWSNAIPSVVANPTNDTNIDTVVTASGVAYAATVSSGNIRVAGANLNGQTVSVGRALKPAVELTRPFPKNYDGTISTGDRCLYRNVKIILGVHGTAIADAVFGSTTVMRDQSVAAVNTTNANGKLSLFVGDDVEVTKIRISSSDHRPMNIVATDIIVNQEFTPL